MTISKPAWKVISNDPDAVYRPYLEYYIDHTESDWVDELDLVTATDFVRASTSRPLKILVLYGSLRER